MKVSIRKRIFLMMLVADKKIWFLKIIMKLSNKNLKFKMKLFKKINKQEMRVPHFFKVNIFNMKTKNNRKKNLIFQLNCQTFKYKLKLNQTHSMSLQMNRQLRSNK